MAMNGCEHPNYLCGFDPTTSAVSYGALSSVRSNDSLKNLPAFALGVPVTDFFVETAPGAREWKNISVAEPGKVSLRLFNSVLNL